MSKGISRRTYASNHFFVINSPTLLEMSIIVIIRTTVLIVKLMGLRQRSIPHGFTVT